MPAKPGVYPITVSADIYGRIYIGARNRKWLQENDSLAACAPRYGSQLAYVIAARKQNGAIVITTRREARKNGWEVLTERK